MLKFLDLGTGLLKDVDLELTKLLGSSICIMFKMCTLIWMLDLIRMKILMTILLRSMNILVSIFVKETSRCGYVVMC